jgi:hypothetical protein
MPSLKTAVEARISTDQACLRLGAASAVLAFACSIACAGEQWVCTDSTKVSSIASDCYCRQMQWPVLHGTWRLRASMGDADVGFNSMWP